jgi:sarcosine oxidase, subunit gamma
MLDLSKARVSPLARLDAATAANVTITAAPAAARFILRGAEGDKAAGTAFDVALPAVPCRAAESGERAALWLGPDEWLLLAPAAEAVTLEEALNCSLAGCPHALVDVSHRQVALIVEGSGAAAVLNSGTPLDLSMESFPAGMVARTIFEKAEIVLWRCAGNRFRLEIWRSFSPYVLALLEKAREDAAACAHRFE